MTVTGGSGRPALPEHRRGDDRRDVAGVLDRPRLRAILDETGPRLWVVRAASGAGKTTLLRTWAVDRPDEEPVVWLPCSEPVGTRAEFWSLVVEAAKRHGDLSTELSSRLLGRLATASDPVEVVVAILRETGPVTLVLDAYEQLGEITEEVDADLLRLIQALPLVRVVLATRGNTRLADTPARLRGTVRVISDRDLALTAEEVGGLLRVHLDRDDAGLARSTVRATGGYALGVRAMILALANRGSVPLDGSSEWNELVAADLRAQLPDESVARFVLLTSVPPYFDLELAARISGRADAGRLLSTLERQGFGRWIPYAPQRPVFQYVDSIRETFVRQLRRADGASHRRASGVAARWLFEFGDYEPAFRLATDGGDYTLASRLYVDLLRVYPEIYISGRLLRQLSSLPRRALQEQPMLAFGLGLARMANRVARTTAPEAFRLAAGHAGEAEVVGGGLDRLVNLSVRAVSLRLLGRFADSARLSLEAIDVLDRDVPEPDDDAVELAAMILRQLSYSLLQAGRFDDAVATMARSAATTRIASTRNYALSYLAGAHGYLGDLPAERAARTEIDPDSWPRDHEHSYLNAMTWIGEGYARLDALDVEGALRLAAQVGEHSPISEFWPFVTALSLHARLAAGEPLAEVRRVQALMGGAFPPPGVGDNTATRHLVSMKAICWLAAGRPAKARRLLAAQPLGRAEVVPARLLQLLLADDRALTPGQLTRWLALPGHTIRTRAATLMLGAAATQRDESERVALALARRAYDLHLIHGVRAHLLLLPSEDRQALADLARRSDDESLADHLGAELPHAVVRPGPDAPQAAALTARERVVLSALVTQGSREEIARALSVSENTVKTQLRSLYRKLGATSRDAAVQIATELELLEDEAT